MGLLSRSQGKSVAATVAGIGKPAALLAAESEKLAASRDLDDRIREQQDLERKLDAGRVNFVLSEDNRKKHLLRLSEVHREVKHLHERRSVLNARITVEQPAYAAAVLRALQDHRRRGAEDLIAAIASVQAALQLLSEVDAHIQGAGGQTRKVLPPLLLDRSMASAKMIVEDAHLLEAGKTIA